MKSIAGIVAMALTLVLLPAAGAGETAGEAKPPRTGVRNQLRELIRADAQAVSRAAPTARDEPAVVPAAGDTLHLEPMVIEEKAIHIPPPETEAAHFFRTGTLWEHVGPKFTKRFWVEGGRGIGFTLSW